MRLLSLSIVVLALGALTGCPDDKKSPAPSASASASGAAANTVAPPSSKAAPPNSGSGW